ncbi:MAG: nucleoside-diphosphate kinase [Candidatus Sifarchaeia archaeon]
MERSLVIIKPDGTTRRRVSALVLKTLLDRGYKICAFREMKVSESLAKLHYAVHKEKPFFPWLVDFISSAPVLSMILEGNDVIQGVRDVLGATFVQKAESTSLRGKYGIWAGINIAHASDAPETAEKEIELWIVEGGLNESSDAEEQARAYIQQYISGNADYTMEIRNVVKKAIEHRDKSDDVFQSLVHFLKKDSKGISSEEIDALASAIFDFVKEEVEKA